MALFCEDYVIYPLGDPKSLVITLLSRHRKEAPWGLPKAIRHAEGKL